MIPPADTVARWTALIHDMLSDNEAIRDELSDDDAVAFMDWGRAQAAQIAARLPADIDDEAVYEAGGTLSRLMSTIKRIIIRRGEKDAEWMTGKFERLNDLSRELWGDAAPTLTEAAIAIWIVGHATRTDSDLLHNLMDRYALPVAPDDTTASPAAAPNIMPTTLPGVTPEDAPEAAPPPPLSTNIDLRDLDLPGRTSPTGEDDEQ